MGVEAQSAALAAEATGNPHILAFLEYLGRDLSAQIRVSRLNTAHYPGRDRLVLEEHRAIYRAIAARDPDKARAMRARQKAGSGTPPTEVAHPASTSRTNPRRRT